MVRCAAIMGAMEKIAPKKLAEEWDNPGLLVGTPEREVSHVLVCLDVRESVVDEAIEKGCEMIVSHHPVIFRAMKKIRTDRPEGRLLAKLVSHGIAVFSAHTNLDSAAGGVNDELASRLSLENILPLSPGEDESLGRIGELGEPMEADAFASFVKKRLSAPYVRLVRAGRHLIKKVGVCGGSAAELIERAAFLGCDAFVTGDVRYHEAERAANLRIHVVEAGHFYTEKIIVPVVVEKLRKIFVAKGLTVIEDDSSTDFFEVV